MPVTKDPLKPTVSLDEGVRTIRNLVTTLTSEPKIDRSDALLARGAVMAFACIFDVEMDEARLLAGIPERVYEVN